MSATAGRRLDEGSKLGSRPLRVLSVLEHRPQRAGRARFVEPVATEGAQRARPIDGFGHSRRLVEPHRPEGLDRAGHLAGQALTRLGDPGQHDGHLSVEVRVLHPVVEGPPLQRVVDIAGAVRREDDHRWHLGPERADLGDRDGEVGQDLEKERLELVVGAVDLVDQEDGLVPGPDGDLRAAWKAKLEREGKLNTEAGSVRDLVLGKASSR